MQVYIVITGYTYEGESFDSVRIHETLEAAEHDAESREHGDYHIVGSMTLGHDDLEVVQVVRPYDD